MTEPGTNARPLAPLPEKPLRGFADLHVHMFSNLAFGGGVIVGRPYSASGGAMRALFPDFATNLDLVSFVGTPLPAVTCPPLVPNCGKTILHGDHTFLDDTAGLGTEDESGSYFGAPIFSGWPTWHSTTHQQVYYKWLERAWRGGMRLMVLLAVNNEVLCHGSKRLRDTDCNDSMKIIENQIIAAKAFERWMKQQPDGKWFEIVETPEEAVQTIRKGNLAVILGVEPDNLFNCKLGAGCTRRYVRDQLERYYNLGVRHIFPIHDFDNEFGGTAVWMDTLNAGNRVMEGEWYDAVTCNGAFSDFSLFNILSPDAIGGTLGQLLNWTTILYPAYPAGPHCNRKGLTPLGVQAIRNMMDLGIIVDVDHMSARSIRQAVVLARERGERGYPLVFGHVTPSDLYRGSRHEFMKSAAQLLEIRRLGGMVGLITTGHKSQTTTLNRTSGAPLVNDCSSSSKTFAETYLYLSEKMGLDVGFGSDFNGMAPHYGPRFGQDACEHGRVAGQQQAQLQNKKMLAYPFTLEGFAKFGRQVTGQRTYDFNYDGFAHIGLYPDLIADLGNVGVKAQDLETLFDSAAAYIRLWKRAKSLSAPPTAEDCTRWKNRRLTQLFKERCGTVAVQ